MYDVHQSNCIRSQSNCHKKVLSFYLALLHGICYYVLHPQMKSSAQVNQEAIQIEEEA